MGERRRGLQQQTMLLLVAGAALLVLGSCEATGGSLVRRTRQYSGYSNVGYRGGQSSRGGPAPLQELKQCLTIHELAHGQAVCAYSGCRLRCLPGYSFIQTATEQSSVVTLSCNHDTGEMMFRDLLWTPAMTICSPVCETTCQNGGTCIAPNKCACVGPYKGEDCSEEPMLGDAPYGGYQSNRLEANERRIECAPGDRMPDGTTSVTLHYRDNNWFYPDGRVLLGVDQITCGKDFTTTSTPYSPEPQPGVKPQGNPNPLIGELTGREPHYVPLPTAGGDLVSTSPQEPVCDHPCLNGGQCVYRNTCSCPRGYWGPTCDDNTCTYPRFENDLHASLGGTLRKMKFECHPNHRTRRGQDHTIVVCVNGVWRLANGRLLVEDDVRCFKN